MWRIVQAGCEKRWLLGTCIHRHHHRGTFAPKVFHINHHDLVLLKNKSMVEGLHVIKNEHLKCSACALGKQHRNEFPAHHE